MGAPTSNRKRGGYSFSLSSFSPLSSPLDSDVHLSKKSKLSPMPLNPEAPKSSVSSSSASLQSTFSRVQAYPKPTEPIRRVIHAPCRNFTFSSRMGNALYRKLGDAKKLAIDTFHTPRKDKDVIDLEEEGNKDVISDDSTAEEINRSDRRRSSERRSVGLAQILDTTTTDDIYLKEKYEHFAAIRRQGSSSVISDLSNQTPLSNRTPKPDDCGKRLESLSLSLEVEEVSEPPHKRLYKDAEKRNSKLRHLSFLIEFTTKKLPFFRRTPKKPEKDLYGDLFVPLTDEEEAEVSRALSNSHRHKLLVTHHDSNIEITGEVLQCLRPGAWLNDEVINLYLELLKEREKREPERFLKCHFFNTFFYKKVISGKGGYDYKAVRRWTTPRKIGYALIDCDKIFVPIHKEIHWCLAIINKKDETFQYLDSLKGRDLKVLEVLARYYVDEVKDKSAKDIDVSSWKREYVHDLPAQENGSDCGMFMIKYADFYSRGLGLNFQQGHMPYFRKRTAHEILKLKAL